MHWNVIPDALPGSAQRLDSWLNNYCIHTWRFSRMSIMCICGACFGSPQYITKSELNKMFEAF